MDGSAIGRGCVTLVLNVIYKGRALPLVWLVAQGRKGHFDEASHCWLIDQLQPFLPDGVEVVFLGDGEFDGVGLQQHLADTGWQYVCRTAKNTVIAQDQETFSLQQIPLRRGQRRAYDHVRFTLQAYGPVQVILWWEKGYQEPLYLVTNVASVNQACSWYRKRFRIETLAWFSGMLRVVQLPILLNLIKNNMLLFVLPIAAFRYIFLVKGSFTTC